MDQILSGRVALVSGASSGIGEATALELARAGAKVAIAARRKDRLEALAAKIRDEGSEAQILVADFSREEEAKAACARRRSISGGSISSSTMRA